MCNCRAAVVLGLITGLGWRLRNLRYVFRDQEADVVTRVTLSSAGRRPAAGLAPFGILKA